MNERLKNVLKWFFITLGVLFLIQFLLILGAVLGLTHFADFNFKGYEVKTNIKPFEKIIKHLDEYNEKNGKYPSDINSIKKDKNYDFEYKTTKDNSCYTLKAVSKKNSLTKEFNKCLIKSDGGVSQTQSFVEYSNK